MGNILTCVSHEQSDVCEDIEVTQIPPKIIKDYGYNFKGRLDRASKLMKEGWISEGKKNYEVTHLTFVLPLNYKCSHGRYCELTCNLKKLLLFSGNTY